MGNNEKFSWRPVYKKIVLYLKSMQEHQSELIDLLKDLGETKFNDQDASGVIELDEIDPLTFFSYLNKYGPKKQVSLLQDISKNLLFDINVKDVSGLPSAQAQKVWFFPYKKDRVNNEIDRLWSFFFSAIDKTITDEQFEDILAITSVGKAKMSTPDQRCRFSPE